MKKLVLFFAIGGWITSNAQVNVKGVKGIGLSAFKTGMGVGVDLSYNQVIKKDLWFKVGVKNEFAKLNYLKFNVSYLYLGLDKSLYNLKDKFFLNIGFGGVGNLTVFKTPLDEGTSFKKNGFNGGLYGQLSVDCYLNDNLVIYPYFRQEYLISKYMGNSIYNLGLGVRYNF